MKQCRVVAGLALAVLLVGGAWAADEKGAAAGAEVKKLMEEDDTAVEAHRDLVRNAPREKRAELYERAPDAKPVVEKVQEFIREYPADDEVPSAASWALLRMRGDGANPIFLYKALSMHHMEHPEMPLATMSALYDQTETGKNFVEGVLEKSENPQAKGAAAYVQAYWLKNAAGGDDKKRLEYLRMAVENLGDLSIRGRSMKASAEGELFAAEHLQIGKVAPDIEGEDVDGVKFKLSDYRGKVVVLDFWGHW